MLRFSDDYASRNDFAVTDLRMTRGSILQAAGMVEKYKKGPPASDDGYVRRALATLRFAIAEAGCYEGDRASARKSAVGSTSRRGRTSSAL